MENNSPAVVLFLILGIIVLASRMAGELARRFDQPRVLGELIVGIILGPTVLNILHSAALGTLEAHLEQTIVELAEIGVMLLMFKIGLEVHLEELAKVGLVAGIAGLLGAILPVILITPLVMLFGYAWQPALFAGVTMAATSVSISAQVLLEIGVLRTKVGNALLATALVDDVLAILLVSLTIAITRPVGNVDAGVLVGIVLRMALYIGTAFVIAWFGLPRLMNWIHAQPGARHSYGVPAFALILAFLFGWSAQAFGGVAAITGAFIAGVGLSRATGAAKHQIDEAVGYIAYAFLVPIFFVSVGLQTDLRSFPLNAIPFAVLMLALAVISKVVGCGLGARLGKFDNREALQLGICMISRGEVGLIIATLGLSSGVFPADQPLFVTVFLVILLTTVLTPPLVRRFMQPTPAVRST